MQISYPRFQGVQFLSLVFPVDTKKQGKEQQSPIAQLLQYFVLLRFEPMACDLLSSAFFSLEVLKLQLHLAPKSECDKSQNQKGEKRETSSHKRHKSKKGKQGAEALFRQCPGKGQFDSSSW